MELKSLVSYKKSYDLSKNIILGLFGFIAIAFVLVIYIAFEKIEAAQNTALVISPKTGQMYDVEKQSIVEMRVYEYEHQAKMVYGLWYGFDENNYTTNIESAMYLLGECGKEMLNSYNDEGVQNLVMTNNIQFYVKIDRCSINMNTQPISGFIEGTQTIKRAKGIMTRNLFCKFTITDCNRSQENPHGCKIDNWEIYNSNKIR